MKKIILLFTLALIVEASVAQKTVYHTQPEQLFNRGKEMFLNGNWEGAEQLLEKFVTASSDTYLKEEAAYMVAVSSFHRGVPFGSSKLISVPP